jgi:hypothetical protein
MNPALENFTLSELSTEIEARLHAIRRGHPIEWFRPAVEQVCASFSVTESALRSGTREAHLAKARGTALWLMRRHTERTLTEIGRVFYLHHGTVIHWVRRIQAAIRENTIEGQQWQVIDQAYQRRLSNMPAAALRRRVREPIAERTWHEVQKPNPPSDRK